MTSTSREGHCANGSYLRFSARSCHSGTDPEAVNESAADFTLAHPRRHWSACLKCMKWYEYCVLWRDRIPAEKSKTTGDK